MDKIVLSPSRVKRWIRCRKSYYWRYDQKLVKIRKEAPMSLGLVIGEALAGYYKEPKEMRSQDLLDNSLQLALARNTSKSDPDAGQSKELVDEWAKIKKTATFNLSTYHDWAQPKDNFTVHNVETPMEIPLIPSVSLLAIPDAVVIEDDGSLLLIFEHKTRYRYHSGDFGIDYQSVGSCLVSGSIGTLYNVIEYRKAKLHRELIIRSEYELDYFRSMFIAIGQDILATPPERMYPMPFKRCSCEYWELCNGEAHGLDLEDIIKELYQTTKKNLIREKEPSEDKSED